MAEASVTPYSFAVNVFNKGVSIPDATLSFTVNVLCDPTSVDVATDAISATSPLTYTIEDDAILLPLPTYTVLPACAGQGLTYELQMADGSVAPEIWDIIPNPDDTATQVVRIYTNDMTLANKQFDFELKATSSQSSVPGSMFNEEVVFTVETKADCFTDMEIRAEVPVESEEALI